MISMMVMNREGFHDSPLDLWIGNDFHDGPLDLWIGRVSILVFYIYGWGRSPYL